MAEHMDQLVPQVGEKWRTDEVYMNMRGNRRYLFAMLDNDTRYWLAKMVAEHKGTSDAKRLFEEARDIGGKVPTWLVSDRADNFHAAWKDLYRAKNFLRLDPLLFFKPARPPFQARPRQAACSASHSNLWFTSPHTTSLIRSYFFSWFRYLSPMIRHVLTLRIACST